MKRKLIRQGSGGYTIYLPKHWVEKKGLKGGEEINVLETDTSLIIGSSIKGKKEITINLTSENKKNISILLTHIYRKGFDIINLKNINVHTLKNIRRITKDLLLGFEVSKVDDSSCLVENISEPSEEKYDAILRRAFLIVKETQNLALKEFESGRFQSFEEISELKNQQDKMILFCRRLLIKEKYELNPIIQWELLTYLMHIHHGFYYLYRYCHDNSIKPTPEMISMLKSLIEYYELYYDYYFKKDERYVAKMYEYVDEFHYGKCFTAIEESKGKNTVVFSYMRELFRLIQIAASPVRSLILD